MALPKQKDVELPLLLEIEAMGGEARPEDIYPKVTARFPEISEADLKETVTSGVNKWTNRIQWARQALVSKGQLERYPHGVWRITEKGRERLRKEGIEVKKPLPLGPTPPLLPRPPTEPDKLAQEIKGLVEKLEELAKKGKEERPLPNHDELVQMVKEIGDMLSKSTEPVPQGEYRHDCVWRPNRWANPELVWEVCDKGVLEKDIVSLTWAANTWKARGILVVFDKADFRRALDRFIDLTHIRFIPAEDVVQLHRMLKAGSTPALKAIFGI